MDASLLADEPSRLNVSVQVANDETTTAAPKSPNDDEPPYSFAYELRYFFYKGVPLGLSSILEWGVPPLFAMVMAGHAHDSATLQASLGFARVFYNTTQIMVIVALSNYFATVVPGCLGAGRKDRLPNYFYRSLLLSFVVLTPLCILNLFAGELTAALGVAPELAEGVGVYCRLMVVTSYLLLLEIHLEIAFVNLGFARCSTFNSLLTGVGVDCVCAYLFILQWGLGCAGAAYVQVAVKAARLAVWALLAVWYRVWRPLLVTSTRERLVSRAELWIYWQQAGPQLASFFTSWFVFELQVTGAIRRVIRRAIHRAIMSDGDPFVRLQIVGLAHIAAIPHAAVAAGAIWIQCESTLAAVQNGWLTVTAMRTLKLLGRLDVGAPKAFACFCGLGALTVAISNAPLLLCAPSLARIVSSDSDVQAWFAKIVWVLALHQQSRLTSINGMQVMGRHCRHNHLHLHPPPPPLPHAALRTARQGAHQRRRQRRRLLRRRRARRRRRRAHRRRHHRRGDEDGRVRRPVVDRAGVRLAELTAPHTASDSHILHPA